MHFDHLTALMPCRGLDDLGDQRSPQRSEEVLSAWSALWHPALVAATHTMPRWSPADSPPASPAGYLILIPPSAESRLPSEWLAEAEAAGARLLRNLQKRPEMVAAALAELDSTCPQVDAELVADFLALGYCHFAIEMLTQRLRYMSNLDEPSFEREVVAAAEAACGGDVDEARQRLQAAFDLLHTAREYFYPAETHLLDLTLVAATTLGPSLRGELARETPTNLLLSAEVLEAMAEKEPASLAALRAALAANQAAIIGGELHELELPLLPPEAIREQLRRGIASYERLLGCRPTVFGRRRFGMTPVLPQIVEQLGFSGIVHATLDDGRFPSGHQSRVRWEGLDGTVVETIFRIPADISRADAFHRLPEYLGNSMDDYVATALFAHWPGRTSPWYDDLHRIRRYTDVMGSFVTVSDYFQRTGMSGQQASYKADEYRSPYLKQAVEANQPDPISRWARYYTRRAAAEAAETLTFLADSVRGSVSEFVVPSSGGTEFVVPPSGGMPPGSGTSGSPRPLAGEGRGTTVSPRPLAGEGQGVRALCSEVDDSLATGASVSSDLDTALANALETSLAAFAQSISNPSTSHAEILVANPWSFTRQVRVETAAAPTPLPNVGAPVQAAGEANDRRTVVVEVPPLGFAWIGPGTGRSPPPQPAGKRGLFGSKPAEPPPLAQLIPDPAVPRSAKDPSAPRAAVLRNEFFELTIDPHTGAIRSVFDFQTRGPRFAQQIAMRLPRSAGDEEEAYSIMAADSVTIRSPGPVVGEIVVCGRLLDRQARRLAGFQQTTRARRGCRMIEIEIELDIDEQPAADPWTSYYASRLAWANEAASTYRAVNQASLPTDLTQFESPHFVDIRFEGRRTTLVTGGLPYHRRIGTRRLDTLLVVRGETCRRFRLGIGVDVPHPMAAALDFLAPLTMLAGRSRPATPFGWLFHLENRNVTATHWEPLVEDARVIGFRVRLLETDGRRVALGVRSFRALKSASKTSYSGGLPAELLIEGDRLSVGLGPYEWAEVEARFA